MLCREAAALVLATSCALPIVTHSLTGPARLTLGDDHAVRSADRLGGGCVRVHLSYRSLGDHVIQERANSRPYPMIYLVRTAGLITCVGLQERLAAWVTWCRSAASRLQSRPGAVPR